MKRFMYLLFFVLLAGVTYAQQAKYVFYFIGDGMGVNQVNGTEMYLAEQEGRIGVKPLLFTQFPAVGVATTFSATNSVTDSSAAGTALATGVKTYNGAHSFRGIFSDSRWSCYHRHCHRHGLAAHTER